MCIRISIIFIISIACKQVYEKLSHAAGYHFNVNVSPLAPIQFASEIIVDPRLFGERYDQASSMEASGGSVTNIHPDDIFSLPAVYAAVCSGVVRNLVSMAPPEVIFHCLVLVIAFSYHFIKLKLLRSESKRKKVCSSDSIFIKKINLPK